MQTSLDKPQAAPQKVKNILIRRTCPKKAVFDSPYQHPETPYILKYAPKYYKSLTLHTTCQSPLLSKVKKIKKLQKFTGYFNRHLPRQLWLNLLGNNRKEIEEAPQISSTQMRVRPSQAFWEKLNQQKLMFFFNMTRVWLPKWRNSILIDDLDNFLSCKEAFVKHIWNLRKLKTLKIMVKGDNYDRVKWVLAKLDGMDGLFKRVETLSLDVNTDDESFQELFKNKKLFSHMIGLHLSSQFDPIFAEVPLICKNLNSFGLNVGSGVDGNPEFRNLLTFTQQLTQLKRLEFSWPRGEKNFWSHFKPEPSLEYLLLRLSVHNLVKDGFFDGDNAVGHWEEMKELKNLEFSVSCRSPEEFNLVKMFITGVLKKVEKLEELKIWVGVPLEADDGEKKTYEPFVVEDMSHLNESLERFEYQFYSWTDGQCGKFDLKTLMPFRNLKSLKLEGSMEFHENIEEIVSLLEENQKEGEDPVLEFNLKRSLDSPADWLRETLRALERTKKPEKKLNTIIDLTFGSKDHMEIMEALCNTIQSVGTIKGLKIYLNFDDDSDYDMFAVDKIKELSVKYPGIRNLTLRFSNGAGGGEWIKIDGEKEQLFFNTY